MTSDIKTVIFSVKIYDKKLDPTLSEIQIIHDGAGKFSLSINFDD